MMSELPTEFLLRDSKMSILWNAQRISHVSSVMMSHELVLHPVVLPVELFDSKGSPSGEVDQVFILYNLRGKRGMVPLDHRLIAIKTSEADTLRLNLGDVFPIDSMASTDLAKRWLQGDSIRGGFSHLYDEAHNTIFERVDLQSEILQDVCTTYGVASHFHPAYNTFGYIDVIGPPISGKSRLNFGVASIGLHPLISPNLTEAPFYYQRQSAGCVIAFDEKKLTRKDEAPLADLVNNAYKKGGYVLRMGKNPAGDLRPRAFAVYGPIQYSGTKILPYMTATRSLTIPIKKTLEARFSQRSDLLPENPEATQLRNSFYLSRLELGFEARSIYDSLQNQEYGITERFWELARPLIATAKLVGKKGLVDNIVSFFKDLMEESLDITDHDEGKVLTVLYGRIQDPSWKDTSVQVKEIARNVVEQFDEEAKEWKSKRVGRALRLLNLRKITTSHGYTKVQVTKAEVEDLAIRYLGQPSSENNSTQSPNSTQKDSLDQFAGRVGEEVEEKSLIEVQGRDGREGREEPTLPSQGNSTHSTLDSSENANEKDNLTDRDKAIRHLRVLKSAPTIEHYIDRAESFFHDRDRAKSFVEGLRKNDDLIETPDGGWGWRK
jgi:hypothetical protein